MDLHISVIADFKQIHDGKNFEIVDTKEKAIAAVRQFKKEGYDEIKITFMVKADVYDAIIGTAKEEGIRVTGHVGPLAHPRLWTLLP